MKSVIIENKLKGDKAMDDRSLVQGLKKQDITAIENTIDKYTRLVSAVICNVACGNLTQQDVEEAVQDTFLSLWEHADSVEEDKLKAYLCQIAKNKARDALRRLNRNRTVSIEEMVTDDGIYVTDDIEKKTLSMAIDEVLSEIGEPDKEIVLRRYYYYQSSSEIGSMLGLNAQTVRTKLSRAKAKLQKLLSERGISL